MVGTGPGAPDLITSRAASALRTAEVIAGYKTYLDLVQDFITNRQEVLSSAMMQEVDRCRKAIEMACAGKRVALVCGGDPGIYAMAGLVFELAAEYGCLGMENSCIKIEIIPGIPALNACAAVLGAPLMHDFAAVSLSDLLTPWELIEKRLDAAAAADFVIVIYNPKSKKRTGHIKMAGDIILRHRGHETPAGLVTAATRRNEAVEITTLGQMHRHDINMQTTVIVGNSSTFTCNNRMVTPRGYGRKYRLHGH